MSKLKNCWKSLTIQFNAIFIAMLPLAEYVKEALPQVQPYLTPNVYKWVGLFVVVVNILLRFKTSVSLDKK